MKLLTSIGMVLIGLIIASFSAQAQVTKPVDAMLNTNYVLAAIDSRCTRIDNIRASVVIAKLDNLPKSGAGDGGQLIAKPGTISAYEVLYSSGKYFVIFDPVTRDGTLLAAERKFWCDGKTFFGLAKESRGLRYGGGVESSPWAQVMDIFSWLQICPSGIISQKGDLDDWREMDVQVKGEVSYRGLTCIKLAWDKPNKEFKSRWGFAYVCPSLGYLTVYAEAHLSPSTPTPRDPEVIMTKFVDRVVKYGDITFPTFARYGSSWIDPVTKVQKSAPEIGMEVVSIKPGAVQSDWIFSPTWAPGTSIRDADGNLLTDENIDTSDLVSSLKMGDFSAVLGN